MKLINSILFYFVISIATLMILNGDSIKMNIFGLIIMFTEYMMIRNYNKKTIYDLLGISWLQNKFKNNPIIMDMTNE